MRIPNGDLAPARRRGYAGSYGRRRSRRNRRNALLAVLLIAVGGAGYYALQRDDARVPTRLAQRPAACPTAVAPKAPAKARALPRPPQIRVALLNGTSRNGLAKNVGDQLAADGFVVTAQGNAPAALAGASQVAFAHGAELAALVAQRWVTGAVTVQDAKVPAGTVRVTLGSNFHRLATPAEAAAALRAPVATAAPAPTVSGCPS